MTTQSSERPEPGTMERRSNPERVPAFVDGTFAMSVPAFYFAMVTVLRDRPSTASDADNFS